MDSTQLGRLVSVRLNLNQNLRAGPGSPTLGSARSRAMALVSPPSHPTALRPRLLLGRESPASGASRSGVAWTQFQRRLGDIYRGWLRLVPQDDAFRGRQGRAARRMTHCRLLLP